MGTRGAVNNNLQPVCSANSRYLTTTTSVIEENGKERILCVVSAGENEKLPEKLTVTVKDSSNVQIGDFSYEVKPLFSLERHSYDLSPSRPSVTIQVKTASKINIAMRKGRAEWVHSEFDEGRGLQTIGVEMRDY